MEKNFKILIVIVLIILLVLILYIITDCIRLSKADFGTNPIITIKEEQLSQDSRIITRYTGLGYTIDYIDDSTSNIKSGKNIEFRIFNFLIWDRLY